MKSSVIDDLKIIINWIKSSEEARLWGGAKIRYPLSIDSLMDDIRFSENHSYSFFDNHDLYGFAQVVDLDKEIGHIARVIIKPEKRGIGLGSRLLGEMIEYCDLNGYKQLNLNVYMSNISAISLYKSYGFQVSKTDNSHSSLTMTRIRTEYL